MQPTAALAALKPDTTVVDAPVYDSTISDLPNFDPWDMEGPTWIKTMSFDTPLNVRVPDDMFAQIQSHAAIKEEDDEEYVGNEVIYHIDCIASLQEIKRLEADPNYEEETNIMTTEEIQEEWGIEPYAVRRNKEANLDDAEECPF